MEKARCNTELYSNLSESLNNVKPSNFWGSHQGLPAFCKSVPVPAYWLTEKECKTECKVGIHAVDRNVLRSNIHQWQE